MKVTHEIPQSDPCGAAEEARAPLSFGQRRIWFLEEFGEGDPVFNLKAALRLWGPLEVDALQAALDGLVARHPALRTNFHGTDGLPVQVVSAAGSLQLQQVDLSHLPPAEAAVELERHVVRRSREVFDLSRDLLIRAELVRMGEDDHLLLLVMHHIVSDGWSVNVLLRDLARLYNAGGDTGRAELPELQLQYADFARAQREQWDGEALVAQARYWKSELEGAPPFLELPTDRRRPAVRTSAGARHSLSIKAELLRGLQQLSGANGCTLFMTLLAAWATLLSRYSGQDDIVVGSPIAGRNRVEVEDLVGFFVNTLALRVDLSGDPAWSELLQRVRTTTVASFKHQELPFDRLVEELKPVRTLSHTPVFQTMLALQNMPRSEPDFGELRAELVSFDCGTSNFDLACYASNEAGGLQLTFEYSTELFEASTIDRLARHYEALLQGIVDEPDAAISALPLGVDPDEAGADTLSEPVLDGGGDELLLDRFEAQVDARPDAKALICGQTEITYAELDERANQLAHHIAGLGVAPGSIVGILLERGEDLVVAVLGTLKAGCAYVPIDPSFPDRRLQFMLADTGAAALLTQGNLRARAAEFEGGVVLLDDDRSAIAANPGSRPGLHCDDEQLIYVIYTSGSTGPPKGVQIRHGAVANLFTSMQQRPGVGPDDRWLAVTTLSFDISVPELLLPLTVGGCVIVAPAQVVADGRALSDELSRSGATVMQATPASWQMLLAAGWEGSPGLKALCGGEALPLELARRLVERTASVWNMYGPTETTVWSSVWRVPQSPDCIRLGDPLRNTSIRVLDGRLKPVPCGVVGEICIGGDGLALGYLGRPELTADRFVPDPVAPGRRIYRTGDLGRRDGNGDLEFLRRIDDQTKVRGFRVELGEIEAVLMEHEAVQQAVAAVQEYSSADRRLVAFFVPAPDQATSVTTLRRYLKKRLPAYAMPQRIVELGNLPLRASGKVDRGALPAALVNESATVEFVEPRTANEELVAAIWREALQIDKVSVHDNFFDLGGHSLLSAQVVAQIEKATGAKLSLRTIMLDTLAQLAASLEPA